MREIKSVKTHIFESGKYLVYITEKRDMFEAWLTRKNFGVMSFMFGSPKKQNTLDGNPYSISFDNFCDMVEANLPEYKNIFELEYWEA